MAFSYRFFIFSLKHCKIGPENDFLADLVFSLLLYSFMWKMQAMTLIKIEQPMLVGIGRFSFLMALVGMVEFQDDRSTSHPDGDDQGQNHN